MGNCLVLQDKIFMVMRKLDGEALENEATMVLSGNHAGHAISSQDADMNIGGDLYYLKPLPVPSVEINKKKMSRYSNHPSVVEGVEGGTNGVVRIKLIISKQELELMMRKGVASSVGDLVTHIRQRESVAGVDASTNEGNCRGWKPVLESIPEVN